MVCALGSVGRFDEGMTGADLSAIAMIFGRWQTPVGALAAARWYLGLRICLQQNWHCCKRRSHPSFGHGNPISSLS
jgi:hypothetical protein